MASLLSFNHVHIRLVGVLIFTLTVFPASRAASSQLQRLRAQEWELKPHKNGQL
jgi:hypothetical protein